MDKPLPTHWTVDEAAELLYKLEEPFTNAGYYPLVDVISLAKMQLDRLFVIANPLLSYDQRPNELVKFLNSIWKYSKSTRLRVDSVFLEDAEYYYSELRIGLQILKPNVNWTGAINRDMPVPEPVAVEPRLPTFARVPQPPPRTAAHTMRQLWNEVNLPGPPGQPGLGGTRLAAVDRWMGYDGTGGGTITVVPAQTVTATQTVGTTVTYFNTDAADNFIPIPTAVRPDNERW